MSYNKPHNQFTNTSNNKLSIIDNSLELYLKFCFKTIEFNKIVDNILVYYNNQTTKEDLDVIEKVRLFQQIDILEYLKDTNQIEVFDWDLIEEMKQYALNH